MPRPQSSGRYQTFSGSRPERCIRSWPMVRYLFYGPLYCPLHASIEIPQEPEYRRRPPRPNPWGFPWFLIRHRMPVAGALFELVFH